MFTRAFHRSRLHRRHRLVPLGVAVALIAAPTVLLPSAASANSGSSLTGSPFNGSDGVLDTTPAVAGHDDVGTPDTFAGGVKEDTDCPAPGGGGAPDKADITTAWVADANGKVGGVDHNFLYLAWARPSNEGTATIDFELNSGTVHCSATSPFLKRVAGQDLLFTYDFQGGSTIGISVRTWTTNHGGEWSDPTTLPASEAEAQISGDQLFGELVVDMSAAGFFTPGVCKDFSSAMAKSRSSSSSFTNQVKDLILPFPIEVTNCGNLKVTKTVAGPGTSGDSFGFTVDCGSYDLNGPAAGDDLTFSLGNGGWRLLEDIPLGTECSVSEDDPGAGHWSTSYDAGSGGHPGLTASDLPIALGTRVVAFTNTRLTGSLTITKSAEGGDGTFLFDVNCSDDRYDRLGDNPVSITTHDGEGSAVLGGLPTGTTCTVSERADALFDSSLASDSDQVEIVPAGATVAYDNTAKGIGITLDKKVGGGDHATAGAALPAHQGDDLDYTVVITNSGQVPLTISSLTDTLKSGFAATCTQGVGSTLDPGDSFTCSYTTPAGSEDAHNVAEVTAIDGLGRHRSASDGTYVQILAPAISVTKTGPADVHVGDPVDYTIVVTNTGNTPLHAVSVSDPKCDAEPTTTDDDGELGLGEQWTYHCRRIAQAGDVPDILNSATAAGTDPIGLTVRDTAEATTNVLIPAIDVTKVGPTQAHVGDPLAYEIVVHNGGNTPLNPVSLTDAGCTGLSSHDADGTLGVDESWTYHCTHVVVDGDGDQYVNTVHVSGQDLLHETVTDDDSWSTDILRPVIEVTKAGEATAHVGDTIHYTIQVHNGGNTPLSPVDVTDDGCTNLSSDDADGTLGVGETWNFGCTHVVLDGDGVRYTNTVLVSGTDALEGETTDEASWSTDILRPVINITKTGPANVHVGDPVVYTLVVTNPGNTPLTGVTVADPKCDGAPVRSTDDADGTLSPGESWTYHCTHVATAADGTSILNTATAQGTDPLGQTVSGTANQTAAVLHPAITIDKTANPESVSVSGPVTYTYVVTNTGDTPLFNVLVTDDIIGAIGQIASLAPGQSATLSKTVVVDSTTPPTNIGTVVGTDTLGEQVTASDPATITVVLAEVATRPEPAQELPRTGAPLRIELQYAITLLEVGILLELTAGRRRRNGKRVG